MWNDCEVGHFLEPIPSTILHPYDALFQPDVLIINDKSWWINRNHSHGRTSKEHLPLPLSEALQNFTRSHFPDTPPASDAISYSSLSTSPPKHILFNLANSGESLFSPTVGRLVELKLIPITTFLMTIEELRTYDVSVGASLSWESMLDNIVQAVQKIMRERFKEASHYRVIVTVDLCGVVIVTRQEYTIRADLVFDRFGQETDFRMQYEYSVLGYSACLLATLAADLTTPDPNASTMDWASSARRGLQLMRLLHREGYYEDLSKDTERPTLSFPFGAIEEEYQRGKYWPEAYVDAPLCVFAGWCAPETRQTVEGANLPEEPWTILEHSFTARQIVLPKENARPPQKDIGNTDKQDKCKVNIDSEYPKLTTNLSMRIAMFETGYDIVLSGADKLRNVPIEKIGTWISADRSEIEGVRSVSNAIGDYVKAEQKPDKPISIAIFGPPGAGKSFVVKQIAQRAGLPGDAVLEFNLSQYEERDELTRAFHAIRDANLRGKTPLVFWDEFDAPLQGEPLGWLRYFLAPIQDGAFTEKGATHSIGPGIHVFVGGTSSSYQRFVAVQAQPHTKKVDFISRLNAYIDVKGPNQDPDSLRDKFYPIRRAILLRSILVQQRLLSQSPDGHIHCDLQVMKAFLHTARYKHGARSMENVVKLSTLAGKTRFQASSLPPDRLLDMHVDARNFTDYSREGCLGRIRIGVLIGPMAQTIRIDNLVSKILEIRDCIQINKDAGVYEIYQNWDNFEQTSLSIIVRLHNRNDFRLLDNLRIELAAKFHGAGHPRFFAVLPMPYDYMMEHGEEVWQKARMRQKYYKSLEYPVDDMIELPDAQDLDDGAIKVRKFIEVYSDVLIEVH